MSSSAERLERAHAPADSYERVDFALATDLHSRVDNTDCPDDETDCTALLTETPLILNRV